MRKLALLICALLMTAGASAQIKILQNGHVRIGTLDEANAAKADSTAALTLCNTHVNGVYGGSLNLDASGNVGVGVTRANYSGARPYALQLKGLNGITYTAGDAIIFSYVDNGLGSMFSHAVTPFTFNVNVKAPQFLVTSDARCKTDINDLVSVGESLDELTPVSYRLRGNVCESEGESLLSVQNKVQREKSENANVQYGFVAQEVREIFPELVYEDEDGMMSIDYNGFIPVLVDAVKNLQNTLEEQDKKIAQLTEGRKLKIDSSRVTASLSQNRPNPFNASTDIDCVIPEYIKSAALYVYDLQGQPMLSIPVNGRGNVTVTIQANSLHPGMYVYALVADGDEIDFKRMILTE